MTGSRIIPSFRYRDAPAAIDFLCEAFGFERHLVVDDGELTSVEAVVNVTIRSYPGRSFEVGSDAESVTTTDLNGDGAARVAEDIGGGAVAQRVDVADRASVQALADMAGEVDILVNNAGVTHLPAPMETVSEADFDRVLAEVGGV